MWTYTLKEAARKLKIGTNTLKRACEQGLIKATWCITESALEEAVHKGIDLRKLMQRSKEKKRLESERLKDELAIRNIENIMQIQSMSWEI